jgi:hypothetical protein
MGVKAWRVRQQFVDIFDYLMQWCNNDVFQRCHKNVVALVLVFRSVFRYSIPSFGFKQDGPAAS